MVTISELLPNPAGSDASGEWVELWNSGREAVNISGWRIVNSGGKKFDLRGVVAGGKFLVLPRSESRLTLRNADEKIYLYDGNGALVDEAEFSGAAPEGKSLNHAAASSYWAIPSPGLANAGKPASTLTEDAHPFYADINSAAGPKPVLLSWAGVALSAAIVAFWLYRTYEDSQNFFGKRN